MFGITPAQVGSAVRSAIIAIASMSAVSAYVQGVDVAAIASGAAAAAAALWGIYVKRSSVVVK